MSASDSAFRFAPGFYAILSTPFRADEALDLGSLARLVDFYVGRGAAGLVALGVMGEETRLDDGERAAVVTAVIEAARGRVPVVAGVSSPSVALTVRRIRRVANLGAQAVMLAPAAGMGPDAVGDLFHAAAAEGIPIVLQDHPQSSGVPLPVPLLARLVEELPLVAAIKNEAPPTGVKTARLRAAISRPVTILGGLGGLSLLDELDQGSDGAMTGFAFPEVLVSIIERYRAGDRAGALDMYHRYLPWLLYESTANYSVAIRKAFLKGRGALSEATVRRPGPALDPAMAPRVTELLDLWEQDGGPIPFPRARN
jgi:4-hydroxy-tetrahydrodipicolinate synthase